MGECFFWYWPTRIVPDKRPLNGCVILCVCVLCLRVCIVLTVFIDEVFFINNVVRLLSYVNMCAYHVYFTINLFTYLLVLTMAACSLHITQLNFSS